MLKDQKKESSGRKKISCQSHIYRGGSWGNFAFFAAASASALRCVIPSYLGNGLGFRPVCNVGRTKC
jgi:hypothetical protein